MKVKCWMGTCKHCLCFIRPYLDFPLQVGFWWPFFYYSLLFLIGHRSKRIIEDMIHKVPHHLRKQEIMHKDMCIVQDHIPGYHNTTTLIACNALDIKGIVT